MFFLVLVCFTTAGHARRVQMSLQRLPSNVMVNRTRSNADDIATGLQSDVLAAFARLLLSPKLAAAFDLRNFRTHDPATNPSFAASRPLLLNNRLGHHSPIFMAGSGSIPGLDGTLDWKSLRKKTQEEEYRIAAEQEVVEQTQRASSSMHSGQQASEKQDANSIQAAEQAAWPMPTAPGQAAEVSGRAPEASQASSMPEWKRQALAKQEQDRIAADKLAAWKAHAVEIASQPVKRPSAIVPPKWKTIALENRAAEQIAIAKKMEAQRRAYYESLTPAQKRADEERLAKQAEQKRKNDANSGEERIAAGRRVEEVRMTADATTNVDQAPVAAQNHAAPNTLEEIEEMERLAAEAAQRAGDKATTQPAPVNTEPDWKVKVLEKALAEEQSSMPAWKRKALTKAAEDERATDELATWKSQSAEARARADTAAQQRPVNGEEPEWKRIARENAENDRISMEKKLEEQRIDYYKSLNTPVPPKEPEAAANLEAETVAAETPSQKEVADVPLWKKQAIAKHEEDRIAAERNPASKAATPVVPPPTPAPSSTEPEMPEWKRQALARLRGEVQQKDNVEQQSKAPAPQVQSGEEDNQLADLRQAEWRKTAAMAAAEEEERRKRRGNQENPPAEVVKITISEESEGMLRAAIMASDEASALSNESVKPADSQGRGEDDYNQRREATVPPKAPGAPTLKAMREALPSFEFRSQILEAINTNQVVIIEGETGCGKTTQVGQYILEEATEKNLPCSIVCTQPRRISAIGVAERVAEERGEHVGSSVGYSIRQERRASHTTHLLFCTTGILLRRLEHDRELSGTTHVIVDEVHERGIETDVILLALRDLSRRRPDLKLILMSATMDMDLFSRYFGGAPGMTIPGRTFPVQDFYWEDALAITRHMYNPSSEVAAYRNRARSEGDNPDVVKREDLSTTTVNERYANYSETVKVALRSIEQDVVNYELLVSLIKGDRLKQLALNNPIDLGDDAPPRPEGVLVFLSGVKEIETLMQMLQRTDEFSEDPARSWVMPLHGGLAPEEQKIVFLSPPQGVRKIVLATNVAETAITIDDIGYVVDTCRMNEVRFDANRRIFSLEDTVISRTNARQRRGRAGRVAPGIAVHVGLTRFRHDVKIEEHQLPEVKRAPLEQVVLRIHATGLHLHHESGKAAGVCAELLEPPDPNSVYKAVEELMRIGAIEIDRETGQERLTALGAHLANLPLEVRLGKLVLFGAAFGPAALDAALTIAAAVTSRPPFLAPLGRQDEADKAKKRFADQMAGGPLGRSDHLAVLAAYREWDSLPFSGMNRSTFCRTNYLSTKSLTIMADMKRSLLQTLSDAGFVRAGLRADDIGFHGRQNDCDGVLLTLTRGKPVEPCPPALVAALLTAALYPQLVIATVPQDKRDVIKKEVIDVDMMVKNLGTAEPITVRLHPASIASSKSDALSPFLVYQELVAFNPRNVNVRDVTTVPPLALALFGGNLREDQSNFNGLIIDNWIKLSVSPSIRPLILDLRKRVDALFDGWVAERDQDVVAQNIIAEQGGGPLLKGIVQLLSDQGPIHPVLRPKSHEEIEKENKEREKRRRREERMDWNAMIALRKAQKQQQMR